METFSASLLSLMISALGSHDLQKLTSTKPSIAKADTLRTSLIIDTEASYFPFSIKNKNGELVGFEIDLMNALCDDMKVQCKIKNNDWDALIPSLKAEKSDAIIAGLAITPDRQEVVDFTQPYYRDDMILVGKKNYRINANNSNALKTSSVAVQRSTQEEQFLDDYYPHLNVKRYDIYTDIFKDLKMGKVNLGFLEKSLVTNWLMQPENKDYEIKGSHISDSMNFAIAMRKGDPMIAKFNQSLANIKANGTYEKISQKYFGQFNITIK